MSFLLSRYTPLRTTQSPEDQAPSPLGGRQKPSDTVDQTADIRGGLRLTSLGLTTIPTCQPMFQWLQLSTTKTVYNECLTVYIFNYYDFPNHREHGCRGNTKNRRIPREISHFALLYISGNVPLPDRYPPLESLSLRGGVVSDFRGSLL